MMNITDTLKEFENYVPRTVVYSDKHNKITVEVRNIANTPNVVFVHLDKRTEISTDYGTLAEALAWV